MNLDIDGVDVQIAHPGPQGTRRSPKIELQVKTSASPEVRNMAIRHRLRVTHFNHLAGEGFQIPRFLAVVSVPPDAVEYAVCTDDHMVLSTAAYWVSLAEHDLQPTGRGIRPASSLKSLRGTF